ncbi:MAG: hypothetical protein C4545_09085 [Anaerolineaceae bacterium]|jgi:hypothetical protein|nr:MAG: hypothetical protein C4545_09085 [Anaerolineaceae bacterium]
MQMKRMAALALAIILLAGFANPVFAQSETDPITEPEPEREKLNPIIQLIADFFRDLFTVETPVVPKETTEPESIPESDGTEIPEEAIPTEEPVLTAEELITAYHEEDELGFGVLVKLLGIAEDLKEECASTGLNCDVDVDTLIEQFKAGVSIGTLTETYGKPETLGVGHIKENAGQNQNKVKNENTHKNGK